MKMMKTYATVFLSIIVAGCTFSETQTEESHYGTYEVRLVTDCDTHDSLSDCGHGMEVKCSSWHNDTTRSRFIVSDDYVSDLNCFAFDTEGRIIIYGANAGSDLEGEPCALYIDDIQADSFSWELPVGQKLSIYIAANMGKRMSVPSSVSDLLEDEWIYEMTDMGDLNDSGIPMGGSVEFTDNTGNSTLMVPLKRIVARYTLSITDGSSDTESYEVTDIRLTNVNRKIGIFSDGDYLSSLWSGADCESATAADLAAVNSGGKVVFYVPENLASTHHALECGASSWSKVYSGLKSQVGYTTFISFDFRRTLKDGQTVCHSYNVVLGEDCLTSFDIVRNTSYDISLTLRDLGEEGSSGQKRAIQFTSELPDVIPVGLYADVSFELQNFISSPQTSFTTDVPGCTAAITNNNILRISLSQAANPGQVVYITGSATEDGETTSSTFHFTVGDAVVTGASDYKVALESPMPVVNGGPISISRSLVIELSDGTSRTLSNSEIENTLGASYSIMTYADEAFETTGNGTVAGAATDSEGNLTILGSPYNCTVNDDATDDNEISFYIRKEALGGYGKNLYSNKLYPEVKPDFVIDFSPDGDEDGTYLSASYTGDYFPQKDGNGITLTVSAYIYSTSAAKDIANAGKDGYEVFYIGENDEDECYDYEQDCWRLQLDDEAMVIRQSIETEIYLSEGDTEFDVEYLADEYRQMLTNAIVAWYYDYDLGRRQYIRVNPDYMRIEMYVDSYGAQFHDFSIDGISIGLDDDGCPGDSRTWILKYEAGSNQ